MDKADVVPVVDAVGGGGGVAINIVVNAVLV